jgi:hypothetical protein
MVAAFLINFLFWTGVTIGGMVFAAFVDITGGRWLGPMRIIAERFTRFLPVSFALFVVLMWRGGDVYPWARTRASSGWFHPAFVALRDTVALTAVYACAFAYRRTSRRARNHVEPARLGPTAAMFLIVYAIGFGVLAIDLIMSLEPRWTSTLFPAYILAGNVYAGTAAVAALSAWTSERRLTDRAIARVRDTANLLVGLALFWTYLFWSQFLVIWYGNLTSEVGYLMARIDVSRPAGWIVLAMCSAVPSIVFIPQWGKRLITVRVVTPLILIGLWLERWLLIAPDLPNSTSIATIAVTAAFAAGFLLSVGAHRVGVADDRDPSHLGS